MNSKRILPYLLIVGTAAVLLGGGEALAFPYSFAGPAVSPSPGAGIPAPSVVPGKEFSDLLDRSVAGPDPEQVLLWDGTGGIADGFDYSFTRPGDTFSRETDALANSQDALFQALWAGGEVFPNDAAMLYSVSSLVAPPPPVLGPFVSPVGLIGGSGDVSYEPIAGPPAHGVWAFGPADIDAMPPFTTDVDGLEVWGPDPGLTPGDGPLPADANRYSHDVDVATGVSVWAYSPGLGVSTPYIPHAAIVGAVMANLGELPSSVDQDQIDLDALMNFDYFDSNPDHPEFDPGGPDGGRADQIIFSIDQIVDPLDPDGYYATGGEVFVLDATGFTTFLVHGGHAWDHAFGLGKFTIAGAAGEEGIPLDLNALEAVATPEPASIAIVTLLLCGLGIAGRRRRT